MTTVVVSDMKLRDVINHVRRYDNATTRNKRNTAALKLASDIYSMNAGRDPWLADTKIRYSVRNADIEAAYAAAVKNDEASERQTPATERTLVAAAKTLINNATPIKDHDHGHDQTVV